MIVASQVLGVAEKLWIRQWGQAYGEDNDTINSHLFSLFATGEYQIITDESLSSHHPHFITNHIHTNFSAIHINADLPRAQDHPLFYIGIYTLIGLAITIVSILSTIAQYTGALRASRILFKRLLLGVVRATMRWHVSCYLVSLLLLHLLTALSGHHSARSVVLPQALEITKAIIYLTTGRMLNRFGKVTKFLILTIYRYADNMKDVMTIDSSLAGSMQAVNGSLATFFAAILTVA
jgi:hypothetical protein